MFKRRLKIFMAIIAIALVGVAARLTDLQLVQGRQVRAQFEDEVRSGLRLLPTFRGRILDRNGIILAEEAPCFDLCIDYRLLAGQVGDEQQLKTRARWAARLKADLARQIRAARPELDAAAAGQEADALWAQREQNTWRWAAEAAGGQEALDDAVQRIVSRVQLAHDVCGREVAEEARPHAVAPGLDETTAVLLKDRVGDMIGASVAPGTRRKYPLGAQAAHIIGYMGPVDSEDLKRLQPQGADLESRLSGYRDFDWVGKAGMERAMERQLRGRLGCQRPTEPDAEPDIEPAVPGQDVVLTLDMRLQEQLARSFPSGFCGAAVAIDVPTGQILAMVSVPTFDLNNYRRDYARLAADKESLPLVHRAVARLYEPGSTAKPLTALAALSEGAIDLSTTFNCERYLFANVTDHFRCTGAHGPLDVVGGLRKSCNIFFYHTGERLERAKPGALMDWFGRFGLNQLPGCGLGQEVRGQLPAITTPAEARMLAIGQGPQRVTPLHVANAMAAIARDGVWLTPTLLAEPRGQQVRRDLRIAPQHMAAVQRGMYEVVNDPGGTAYRVFHAPGQMAPDVPVCGKTGTAQTAPLWEDINGNRHMEPDEVVRRGNLAWFAGFAPYRKPRIAFAVVVEYVTEGGGASNAGPVARELIRACRDLGYFSGSPPAEWTPPPPASGPASGPDI